LELPRHALPRGIAAVRGCGRAAGGARSVDAAHDRERLPAHRPDRTRRLGRRRGAPRRAPGRAPGVGAHVQGARGGDVTVITIRTIAETREALRGRDDVGLVPTMGAYHEGHLSLFRAARAGSETVVASLLV